MRAKTIQSDIQVSKQSIPLQDGLHLCIGFGVVNGSQNRRQEMSTYFAVGEIDEGIQTKLLIIRVNNIQIPPKPLRREQTIPEINPATKVNKFDDLHAFLGEQLQVLVESLR